jgi:hypothetical protein
MKLPLAANIITDRRLTSIAILKAFCEKGARLDQLKDQVKQRMRDRDAKYAQSELVMAHLVSSEPKRFVDPKKFYHLVKTNRVALADFLACICVRTSQLPRILSESEIENLLDAAPAEGGGAEQKGALYTDWKDGAAIDLDAIEDAMVKAALEGTIK